MRVEPYGIGSVVHVIKRGVRGSNIVRDDDDKWRFVRSLYLLNDNYKDENWWRDTKDIPLFERPPHWPERLPLTAVLGWTLMPNHFHLLLLEIQEGGIAKFMQRLCGSMTVSFNLKYKERGSLFQGSYKSKTVDTDEYLRYLFAYILVKNTFELYPGGLASAYKNFDKAWDWSIGCQFSSFGSTVLGDASPIVDSSKLSDLGLLGKNFKQTARNMFTSHMEKRPSFAALMLEKW